MWGGAFAVACPTNINKSTFCETVGGKTLVPSLKTTCSLQIRDLVYLTEKVTVEETIKRETPKTRYDRSFRAIPERLAGGRYREFLMWRLPIALFQNRM